MNNNKRVTDLGIKDRIIVRVDNVFYVATVTGISQEEITVTLQGAGEVKYNARNGRGMGRDGTIGVNGGEIVMATRREIDYYVNTLNKSRAE